MCQYEQPTVALHLTWPRSVTWIVIVIVAAAFHLSPAHLS
jgi:hypothetical protein